MSMTQGDETSAGTPGSPTPAAHTQIGRYKILRELGRGAMGVVYEAVDPKIGRKVALKVLHDVAGISPSELDEFRSRFFREARTAGMLSHRNIVVIHDVDHDEQVVITYMAMELLKGQSIRDLLRSGVKFTTEQALDVCIQVAEGLDHAHRQGIVHRDVKPDNLMLLEDGTVKITDFGIAKISTSNLTRTGQFIGTPNYMSPEQVIGHVIDGRSDLFSLGIILYELLTGEKPFMGSSLTTITYQIVNVDPIEPSKIRPGIPKYFDAIVAKLLRKAPDERYQTGKEVAEALRATRDGGTASQSTLGGNTSNVGNSDATHVSMGSSSQMGGNAATIVSGAAGAAASAAAAAAASASTAPRPGISKALIGGIAAVIVLGVVAVAVLKMAGGHATTGATGPAPTNASGPELGPSGALGATTPVVTTPASGVTGPAPVPTPNGATGPVAATGAPAATGPKPTPTGATGPKPLPSGPTGPRPHPVDTSLPPLVFPPGPGSQPTKAPEAVKPAAPESTSMVNLSFDYKVKEGTLTVMVDGKQVSSLAVSSEKKMKHESASTQFSVPEGRHEVRLCLASPEIDDGPKCAYKQFAFVMNRTATIHAEDSKPMMGKHLFSFSIE
jgi:serine/threonine protein kinase